MMRTSSTSSTGLSGREGGGGAADEAARAIRKIKKLGRFGLLDEEWLSVFKTLMEVRITVKALSFKGVALQSRADRL